MEKMIGNYQIECELGSGGFGRVYKGYHSILTERTVAMKVLHSHVGSSEEHEQFLQEARFLEHLKHPNILHIFDVGVDQEGFPYLVSAYASGGSLRALLKQHASRPLPEAQVISIIAQIGEALQYAHQQRVLHRDLKPENILFDNEGKVLLADFGIAVTLTTASIKAVSIMGTPPYMAPEQFQGKVCRESDQYGLGCIAYELVTGRQPFTAPDFYAMGFQHLSASPIPPRQFNPELSPSVERAILKAINKQRTDRHATVEAFITALKCNTIAEEGTLPVSQTGSAQVEPAATFPSTYSPAFSVRNENDVLTLPSGGHAAIQARGEVLTPLPLFFNSSDIATSPHQQGPTTPFPPLPHEQMRGFGAQISGDEAFSRLPPSAPYAESTTGSDRSFFTAHASPFSDWPVEEPAPPQSLQKQNSRRKPLITIMSFVLVGSLVSVLLFVALAYAAGNTQSKTGGTIIVPTNTAVSSNKSSTPSVHTTSGVKPNATILVVNPVATMTPGVLSTPIPSITPTPTAGITPTPTAGITPTPTAGITPTPTPGITPTPTPGITPTPTAGITPTPTAGITPTPTAGITPTPTPFSG